ncbi:hypothetical protein ABENE_15470 [Asticcacaulis benevestitus DSM 16100 = ATCC BAA-896]|uniref:Uncharacterized protein n=1 Tax=Asticcacaulis benevestitus DSM 16100 = ATCC BAA-896 TaxID=1121022 RepID=V4PTB8_9CAUL|nr:hypothetical protein ABENE_15470 [Asticcacaulis benevestitus DSM 16100 = ATCC BAA-896]
MDKLIRALAVVSGAAFIAYTVIRYLAPEKAPLDLSFLAFPMVVLSVIFSLQNIKRRTKVK